MSSALAKGINPFSIIANSKMPLIPINPRVSDILWHINMTHSSSDHPIIFYALHQTRDNDRFQWGFKKGDLTDNNLSQIVNLSNKGFNVYMSQSSFLRPHRRTKDNAFSSECIIIDIDYYIKPHLKGLSSEKIIALMESQGLFTKAKPSYAMSSGNGLYLVYLLERVPLYGFKNIVRLWELTAKALVNHFKDFGADPKATDVSRVNRLPWSINQKTKKEAYILDFAELKASDPCRYTLSALADKVLPYSHEEILTFRKKPPKRKKVNKSSSQIKYLFNPYSLALARCKDLEKLLELRDYSIDGYRNTLLFLYSVFALDKLSNLNSTLAVINNLNNKLDVPLPSYEIQRTVQSSFQNHLEKQRDFRRGYKFTNKRIIEWLDMTEEEIAVMETIISKDEKLNRLKIAQKAKRRNADGLTSREQKVKDHEILIKSLKEQGLSNKEISEEVNLSIRQVQRYLAK